MEVNANDRRTAPAQLVDIELQTGQIAEHGMSAGNHMTLIVAVVIVCPNAYGCRETVKNLVGEVYLSAKDVLLALHL